MCAVLQHIDPLEVRIDYVYVKSMAMVRVFFCRETAMPQFGNRLFEKALLKNYASML